KLKLQSNLANRFQCKPGFNNGVLMFWRSSNSTTPRVEGHGTTRVWRRAWKAPGLGEAPTLRRLWTLPLETPALHFVGADPTRILNFLFNFLSTHLFGYI